MLSGPDAFSGLGPMSNFSTPCGWMVKGAILTVISGSNEVWDSLENTDLNSPSRILALVSQSVKRVLPCSRVV